MMYARIDQQVMRIAAQVMGVAVADIEAHTPIAHWSDKATINDETCIALNLNISTQSASQCRTVGEYCELVERHAQQRF
ncbi:hypothetical protein EBQ26_04910 [Allofranklinella schreckenbergeri]|uniref:Uncharacterized protein n=1 Tax=Allofranklinella schreckenbergeri TaxID=1076744 RepID=A0A3M6Q9S4_9BURK|nr:hypothetical protein [Allofranklinella schreckenbergeri]RMW99138.1 hypothetical protein EBQ26_04910 [Allofranklinella schreckenbergeri]RMW99717.1 hypothetical protein EBQ25_06515 [Allofranklinella schreckenbergeri]RMX11514.1 hypothetical protein EBQ24_00750 [Allofranklinella schreckenbergeri]RRD42096.1 hypothetical protein EII18_06665 [Comamonadaceae bacterium OH3737_COT-264]